MPLSRAHFFFGFLIFAVPGLILAQKELCDSQLIPIAGILGYKYRENDARCEGLYESPVAGVIGLEVVSFLRGKLRFDIERHKHLKVTAPKISDITDSLIRIRAVSVPVKMYYQMDSVLPPGGTLIWPLDEILKPMGLTASGVGLFGWVNHDTDIKAFVPLTVVPSKDEMISTANTSVELTLRAYADIERVLWREITEDLRTSEQPHDWQDAGTGFIPDGRPITLPLPITEAAPFSIIEIAAKRQGSNKWLKLKLRVIGRLK